MENKKKKWHYRQEGDTTIPAFYAKIFGLQSDSEKVENREDLLGKTLRIETSCRTLPIFGNSSSIQLQNINLRFCRRPEACLCLKVENGYLYLYDLKRKSRKRAPISAKMKIQIIVYPILLEERVFYLSDKLESDSL